MIARCKKQFPASEWILLGRRLLELKRKFDVVIAWHSFFHLGYEAQQHALVRFIRHLKQGGLLVFTSGPERGEMWSTMEVNGSIMPRYPHWNIKLFWNRTGANWCCIRWRIPIVEKQPCGLQGKNNIERLKSTILPLEFLTLGPISLSLALA